mgnify:CR=1 FL=1
MYSRGCYRDKDINFLTGHGGRMGMHKSINSDLKCEEVEFRADLLSGSFYTWERSDDTYFRGPRVSFDLKMCGRKFLLKLESVCTRHTSRFSLKLKTHDTRLFRL